MAEHRSDAEAPRPAGEFPQELFTPSIDRAALAGPPPWRVSSQFWVYFFGGVLSGGVIAYLNAKRLGVTGRPLHGIAALTAVGLVLSLLAAAVISTEESSSGVRLATRVVALVVGFLPAARLQRAHDRAAQLRGVEPASLWGAGAAAVIGLGAVQAILVAVVAGSA